MFFSSNITRLEYNKFVSDFQSPIFHNPKFHDPNPKAFVFVDDRGMKFLADVMGDGVVDSKDLFALGIESDGPLEMLVIGAST